MTWVGKEWLLPCVIMYLVHYHLTSSEGPTLQGGGWSRRMSMVMRNGHTDMRSWQGVLDATDIENEARPSELDTPPDIAETKQKITETTVNSRKRRFVTDKKKLRWTHAVIPYVFDHSVGVKSRRHIEHAIFGLYEYWTHFRFVHWNTSVPDVYQLNHRNYLIFVEYDSACWSYTGNNRVLNGQSISCCRYDRCIHEIGHAIGFYHEISNPLRDDYVRINHRNILTGMVANFEKITKGFGMRQFGYYDMSSVMGYSPRAFSKNWRDTMTVLDPELQYLTMQKDVTGYYMFYEAQLLYDMQVEKCPDVTDECINGGYLSYVNGTCRCRCPQGLDHKSNCATLEVGVGGAVINMSSITVQVNITSPGYPNIWTDMQHCIWFVKGPVGSKIAVDFNDFHFPHEDDTCSTYLELRFAMPGQPGVKYCGEGISNTIISYGEYLAISMVATNGSNQGRFAVTLRLIKDDLCYTDNGKDGSYQGRVNYARNFETCLPWDKVTSCSFHTFNVTWMDLESNFCRNPGHGTQPWCYVNADNCARSYCDVCHLRRCYDVFDDCDTQMLQNRLYCRRDPEATRGCRQSCGLCNDPLESKTVASTKCGPPITTVQDGELISNPQLEYRVGDKVTYRCTGECGRGRQSATCTPNGTWTHIGCVCEDNPNCVDERLDCDTLLERTPAMCNKYANFATLKCARTCSMCSPSDQAQQRVECGTPVDPGNVTEASRGPYYAGDHVQFECIDNFVHVGGDLDRACKHDNTLTGSQPQCISAEEAISDLYHVDLRRRRHTSPGGSIYTFSNVHYRITRKGEITTWQFYSKFSGQVTFHIWRQAGNTSSFKLLGSFDVTDSLEDRLVTVNVPKDCRTSVEPGDFIGIYVPTSNPGGIAYDKCKTKYDPQGGGQLSPHGQAPWHVGLYYAMKPLQTCMLFSISAKIGPPRNANVKFLRKGWNEFISHHG